MGIKNFPKFSPRPLAAETFFANLFCCRKLSAVVKKRFLEELFRGCPQKEGIMRGEKFEQLSGQKTFASCSGFDCRRKTTRRHLFLQTMNQIMPWQALVELVEPYWPKQDGPGRPTKPLLWMLKLYFLQIWFHLSDPQTEELMHTGMPSKSF
jgi:hypothetical protein